MDEANPQLAGLFSCLDLSDRDSFPPSILLRAFERLDAIRMRSSDVDADGFDRMCEALIQDMEGEAGRPEPSSQTPPRLVRLLVEILQPQEGMSIYDGACGSGGMLLECCRYLRRAGKNHESLRLYGQELDPAAWALCRVNLACHGIPSSGIENGDTLRGPRHLTGDGRALMTFDRVISHPPFLRREWGFDEWAPTDRYGRSEYGLPPRCSGYVAFLEHSLASLNGRGMLGVVAPLSVLTRGGEEGEIRRRMIKDDLVEAAVSIGQDVLSPPSDAACVLIMNRAKARKRRGSIFLVNGDQGGAGASEHDLSEESVNRIGTAFRSWQDREGLCRTVSQEEIDRDDAVLDVSRFVPTGTEKPRTDLADEWQTLLKLIADRNEAERAMVEHIRRLERGPGEGRGEAS
ncbi:MAG: hypothetical protein A2177_03185 [Spirochaetes bacterium RBG_13_68_11]|nr:MAG: hypothetical protein A2177_03185 [Spirochaetes bacterium RBG_13_68_11]